MEELHIHNPFNAPVYYKEKTASTMDEGRLLASGGAVHGTVIAAGVQEAGRGRISGRPWLSDSGNLYFTIVLRYAGFSLIPRALTLRAGLAAAMAIEDFAPRLSGIVQVKWPNDVMIGGKKIAGILTESDGKTVFMGMGVNAAKREFSGDLALKATSIGNVLGAAGTFSGEDSPFLLLEKILFRLHGEFENSDADLQAAPQSWQSRLDEKLYMKGRRVRFIPGAAGSQGIVPGILEGIGSEGELLLLDDSGGKLSFVTGELDVYPQRRVN
jgi:BirA family biotin operon repressor/biotin-[acetyl-CoA-carboxylase] ligase